MSLIAPYPLSLPSQEHLSQPLSQPYSLSLSSIDQLSRLRMTNTRLSTALRAAQAREVALRNTMHKLNESKARSEARLQRADNEKEQMKAEIERLKLKINDFQSKPDPSRQNYDKIGPKRTAIPRLKALAHDLNSNINTSPYISPLKSHPPENFTTTPTTGAKIKANTSTNNIDTNSININNRSDRPDRSTILKKQLELIQSQNISLKQDLNSTKSDRANLQAQVADLSGYLSATSAKLAHVSSTADCVTVDLRAQCMRLKKDNMEIAGALAKAQKARGGVRLNGIESINGADTHDNRHDRDKINNSTNNTLSTALATAKRETVRLTDTVAEQDAALDRAYVALLDMQGDIREADEARRRVQDTLDRVEGCKGLGILVEAVGELGAWLGIADIKNDGKGDGMIGQDITALREIKTRLDEGVVAMLQTRNKTRTQTLIQTQIQTQTQIETGTEAETHAQTRGVTGSSASPPSLLLDSSTVSGLESPLSSPSTVLFTSSPPALCSSSLNVPRKRAGVVGLNVVDMSRERQNDRNDHDDHTDYNNYDDIHDNHEMNWELERSQTSFVQNGNQVALEIAGRSIVMRELQATPGNHRDKNYSDEGSVADDDSNCRIRDSRLTRLRDSSDDSSVGSAMYAIDLASRFSEYSSPARGSVTERGNYSERYLDENQMPEPLRVRADTGNGNANGNGMGNELANSNENGDEHGIGKAKVRKLIYEGDSSDEQSPVSTPETVSDVDISMEELTAISKPISLINNDETESTKGSSSNHLNNVPLFEPIRFEDLPKETEQPCTFIHRGEIQTKKAKIKLNWVFNVVRKLKIKSNSIF